MLTKFKRLITKFPVGARSVGFPGAGVFTKKQQQLLGDKPKDILGGVRPPTRGEGEPEVSDLEITETPTDRLAKGFTGLRDALDRYKFRHFDEYCKYGLVHDDLLTERASDVKEAMRRLPEDLYDARIHRQHRALNLSKDKVFLPKEMWTAYDDPNHFYAQPYLKLVQEEIAERKIWDSK